MLCLDPGLLEHLWRIRAVKGKGAVVSDGAEGTRRSNSRRGGVASFVQTRMPGRHDGGAVGACYRSMSV